VKQDQVLQVVLAVAVGQLHQELPYTALLLVEGLLETELALETQVAELPTVTAQTVEEVLDVTVLLQEALVQVEALN
jgi:hypothetical protein